MELKTVGKIGMVKRKQFLQNRDISRSHEVKINVCFFFSRFKKRKMMNNDESIMCNIRNNYIKVHK
jgi:hypothetical protein